MKKLSLQWRITLLTAALITAACLCLNILLYRSGATGMDSIGGFVIESQLGDTPLQIQISDEQALEFVTHFSRTLYTAKAAFWKKSCVITALVTLFSAAIAFFVSGKALKPLRTLAKQTETVNQDSLRSARLDEGTIQEFQQLSHSVNQMLDRLAQSFTLQQQFAGNAAHELRTPLALLQTRLELFMEEHPNLDSDTAALANFQLTQLERLTALVRTLLEMSNLQSVSCEDSIALAPLVEEVLTDLTPLADQHHVTLHQDCEDVTMIGSDALIYRLVFNLTENAVKYNRENGVAVVCIRREKDRAVIRVSDTGPGIPQEYQRSVFQPFFRVDKSRSRQMGGVGLGLALVREIAALHQGSICVEQSSEQGTTFSAFFPIA